MKNKWQWVYALCALGTLIPLGVENYWNISIQHYDLRIQYLAVALLGLVFACQWLTHSGPAREQLRAYLCTFFREPFVACLAILLLVGLLSLTNSENVKRTFFIWLWGAGTFLAVPFAVQLWLREFGAWFTRALALVLFVHGFFVFADTLLCNAGAGWSLGRVYMQGGACRPHAWFHEPSFYAASMTAQLFWIRQVIVAAAPTIRRWYVALYLFLIVSIILCTSRMGWLAMGLLVTVEVAWGLRHYRHYLEIARQSRYFISAAIAAGILLFAGAYQFTQTRTFEYTSESVQRMFQGTDGSLQTRSANMDALMLAFKDHPLVGVGTGTLGAYLAKNYPEHPTFTLRWRYNDGFQRSDNYTMEERLKLSENLSYANTVAGEMLGEWGLLGALALLAAWFFLFRHVQGVVFWQLLVVGPVICLVWQTVQRFDMWVAMAMLWQISQHRNIVLGQSPKPYCA